MSWWKDNEDAETLLDTSFGYAGGGKFYNGYDTVECQIVSKAEFDLLGEDKNFINKAEAARRARLVSDAWARLAYQLQKEADDEFAQLSDGTKVAIDE